MIPLVRRTNQGDTLPGGIYKIAGDGSGWEADDGIMLVAHNFRIKICMNWGGIATKADTWSNWESFKF